MRHVRILGVAMVGALALSLTAPMAWAEEPTPEPGTEAPTLSSRLAETAESGVTEPAEIAAALSLPAEGGGSLDLDANGDVLTTVFFTESPSESILDSIRAIGTIEELYTITTAAAVRIDPSQIEALQSLPGVLSATPALTPMTGAELRGETSFAQRTLASQTPVGVPANACNPVPVDADAALRTGLARELFGVNGTGVTIGIISDSFALTTEIASWQDDVASGALPGPTNPCGHLQPVEVLKDDHAPETAGDEGRAMAQLVHGIAPGAKILFATSGDTELDYAQSIEQLADAGADIIVDDITFTVEPYFQQSFISITIEELKRTKGIAYFSSAGNATAVATSGPAVGAPLSSWQTTDYRGMECPDWVNPISDGPYDCLDFDPSAAEAPYDRLEVDYDTTLSVAGSIGEPMFGVTTSYELHFYEEQADPATDPLEIGAGVSSIGWPYPGLLGALDVSEDSAVRMVFVRTNFEPNASQTPVYVGFLRGSDAIASRSFMGNGSTDVVGSTIFGHHGDGSTIGVAALDWQDPTRVRPYSSLGPNTMYFEPPSATVLQPAARYAEPLVVNSPGIATVDGVRTSFFSEIDPGAGPDEYRFSGTSAAAPIAAAAFALSKQYAPTVPSSDLTQFMKDAAEANSVQPENPYSAFGFTDAQVFGAGLFDAVGTLERLPIAGFDSTSATADSIRVNWSAAAGPQATLVLDLYDEGITPRTLVQTVALPAGATTHTFEGLQASHDYSVELTATIDSTSVARGSGAVSTTAAPVPGPGPQPAPNPLPDEQAATSAGAASLSNTGSGDAMLWAVGAGTLLVLGAIAIAVSLRSRARRGVHQLS